MAQKILIANIGNRNVNVLEGNNQWLDIDEYIKKKELTDYLTYNNVLKRNVSNIKEFSKDLFEKKIEVAYRLNILTGDVIESEVPAAVLLFSTLQSNSTHDYQDTYYCGELAKGLLEEKYCIPIHNFLVDANPSSEDELFPIYAKYFREVKNTYPPDLNFSFIDAGGTSQMKTVIKTLLDFYFNSKVQIRYQSIGKKVSEVPKRDFHQQYSYLKLAENFIDEFNYNAALKIVSQIPKDKDSQIDNLIKHLDISHKRMNFDYQNARSLYINDENIESLYKDYLSKIPLSSPVILSEFYKRSCHDILEIASIVDLYFELKDFTLGVATYYRLVEEIGQSFIEYKTGLKFENIDKKGRASIAKQLKLELGANYPYVNDDWNVPLLIAAMSTNKNFPHTQKLADLIKPSISGVNNTFNGINILRNQCYLAHKNQAITKGVISKTCKGFFSPDGLWNQLKSELGLPQKNIYNEMNEILKGFIVQF